MWERSTPSIIRQRFLEHQLMSIKHCYFFQNTELVLTILVSLVVEVGLAFNRHSVSVFEQTEKKAAKKKYRDVKGNL